MNHSIVSRGDARLVGILGSVCLLASSAMLIAAPDSGSPRGALNVDKDIVRVATDPSLQVLEKNVSEAHVIRSADRGSIKRSIVLSDGSNWTLAPQGAVLFVPESHTGKINGRPIGNLLSWGEFLRLNRTWIQAEEVTLRQAKGVEPIDERRVNFWFRNQKVIVATHLGTPIARIVSDPETAESQ